MGMGTRIRRKAKEKPSKHDGMHESGSCGCMNRCCYVRWIHTRGDGTKVKMGACVCPDCGCESSQNAHRFRSLA